MNNNARSCLWDFQWLNVVITHNMWFFIFSPNSQASLDLRETSSLVWCKVQISLLTQNQNACKYFYDGLRWSRRGVPISAPSSSTAPTLQPSQPNLGAGAPSLSSKNCSPQYNVHYWGLTIGNSWELFVKSNSIIGRLMTQFSTIISEHSNLKSF